MTKKHFILLAEALKNSRPGSEEDSELFQYEYDQWKFTRGFIIRALKSTNPQFDSERFKEWTEK